MGDHAPVLGEINEPEVSSSAASQLSVWLVIGLFSIFFTNYFLFMYFQWEVENHRQEKTYSIVDENTQKVKDEADKAISGSVKGTLAIDKAMDELLKE